MATKGSTYGQALPATVEAHRKLLAQEAEAAKSRRAAKARRKREAK